MTAASCLNIFKLSFLYVRRARDCFVVIIGISVFSFFLEWASNGVIFVVEFGMSLIFSIMFANRLTKVAFDQLESRSSTANLLFIVWMRRSTITVPLGSPAGARIILRFLFSQKFSNSFTLNAWAWSADLMFERGGIVRVYLRSLACSYLVCYFWKCVGTAKAIWISSSGFVNVFSVPWFFSGSIGFKFLPYLIQCLQLCAWVTILLCICGYHTILARASIPAWPVFAVYSL